MPLLPETSSTSPQRESAGIHSRTSSSSSSPSSFSWDDSEADRTDIFSGSSQGIEALLRFVLNRRPPLLNATRTDSAEYDPLSNTRNMTLTRDGTAEHADERDDTNDTPSTTSNRSETTETNTQSRTLDPYGLPVYTELSDILERITRTDQISTPPSYNQPSLQSQTIPEYNRNNYEVISTEETILDDDRGSYGRTSDNASAESYDWDNLIGQPDENSQTTLIRRVLQPRQTGPSWVVAEFRQPLRRSQLSTMITADNERTESTTFQELEPQLDLFPDWLDQQSGDPGDNFMVMLRWREEGMPTRRPELRGSRPFTDLEVSSQISSRSKLLMAISSKLQIKRKTLSYVSAGANFQGRIVALPARGLRSRYNLVQNLEQECGLHLSIRRVDTEHNRITCVLRKTRDSETMSEDVWEGEMLEGPYRGEGRGDKVLSRPRLYNLTSFWKHLYPNHSLNGVSLVGDPLNKFMEKPEYTSANDMLQRAAGDYVWLILRNTTSNGYKMGPHSRRQQLLLSVNRKDGSAEGCLQLSYAETMLVYLEPELISRRGGCPDVMPC